MKKIVVGLTLASIIVVAWACKLRLGESTTFADDESVSGFYCSVRCRVKKDAIQELARKAEQEKISIFETENLGTSYLLLVSSAYSSPVQALNQVYNLCKQHGHVNIDRKGNSTGMTRWASIRDLCLHSK